MREWWDLFCILHTYNAAMHRFEAGAERVRALAGVVKGALEVQVEDPESLGTYTYAIILVYGTHLHIC